MSPLAIGAAVLVSWLAATVLVMAMCRAATAGDHQLPELAAEHERPSVRIVRPARTVRSVGHARSRPLALARRARG
jgi:hypothetical protein